MRKLYLTLFTALISCLWTNIHAQKIFHATEKSKTVCYASPENIPTRVEAPKRSGLANARAATTSNIVVEYNGFTPQAQEAFQRAIDIWEGLLSSPVTIRVRANWVVLATGVLGSCGPSFYASDFEGAPNLNVAYAGALAEKLAGKNLNDPEEFDIEANFSSVFTWYYAATGTPPAGQYDLTSVVLHELGHGLGFADTYNFVSPTGTVGAGFSGNLPNHYDIHIENQAGANLYESFASETTLLGGQLTSNNLFIDTYLATLNNGQRPKIYAPTTWSGGSSIAHLDEATYGPTHPSTLMTPQIGAQQVIHDPGPITLDLFKDFGWTTVYINHEQIANTEDINTGAFTVTATVIPDETESYALGADPVYLHYYTSANATVVSVPMAATANPNEYAAALPAPGGVALDYFYYISAADNLGRVITKPGKVYAALEAPEQGFITFHVGEDTADPVITHEPLELLPFQDTEVEISVEVVDALGLDVELEYTLDGVAQSNLNMSLVDSQRDPITGLTTYSYEVTVSYASLADGEEFAYRIVAEDNSINANSSVTPTSDFYRLTFKGLKSIQNNYDNDFDIASDDFIGVDGHFSIAQVTGFDNPAIHSIHPYLEADPLGKDFLEYIYTLRVPILVSNVEASIKFDEVVLVEPATVGSVFGDANFWDYSIVEGSIDGGHTWTPVADGYNCREYAPWLTRYNSSTSGNNSTAVGDKSLFRSRKLNLLDEFDAGDEVIIRFRLWSDPLSAGWGWTVDNLKIQIDDEAPELLHQHVDLLKVGTGTLQLVSEITDNISIENATLEFGVNDQPTETLEIVINDDAAEATFTLEELDDLTVGDKIIYRISSEDVNGNSVTIPAEGYFEVPVVDLHDHVDQYTNDFDSETDDFVGNFFSVEQPSGFQNGAIHSSHDYLIGFGGDHVSDFTYTLKTPIVIVDNMKISYDEIVIVEGHDAGAVFGTPAFNDYVIVEGSKDEGETWQPFTNGYDAKDQTAWQTAFNNGTDGTPSLFRPRVIDMTENGNFAINDHVNVRFRLFSNDANNGWGWAIDNLSIQEAITGAEKQFESAVSVYPNPSRENITVEASGLASPYLSIQLTNVQGRSVYSVVEGAVNGKVSHTISGLTLPAGLYFVKITNEGKTVVRKVTKTE